MTAWQSDVIGDLTEKLARRDDEIERLRTALTADDEGSTAYQSGWHARDAEVERLREANIRHNAWFQEEVERRAAAERKQHAAEAEIERLERELAFARETATAFREEARRATSLLLEERQVGVADTCVYLNDR